MPSTLPEPGQIVIVRHRPFVVNDIQTSTLPLPSTVQDQSVRQHLLRLSSMEDEGLGEELSVIWKLEPGVTCLEKAQLPSLKEFDPPRVFDARLLLLRLRPTGWFRARAAKYLFGKPTCSAILEKRTGKEKIYR